VDSVIFVNYKLAMKAGFYLQGVFLCLLIVGLTTPSFAQYISDPDADYLLEDVAVSSVIPPFYQNLDEKSYYHSRQIHGMKEDMNAHARNLRDLRMRFNQVFYGRKTSASGEDPFQVGGVPQMPVQKEVSPKVVYIPPPPKEPRVRYELPQADANIGDDSQMTPDEEMNPDNLLAFSVKEPGSYQSHDGRQINPEISGTGTGLFSKPRRFDYYIMPRILVAIPSRIEKNIHHPPPHYKRYKVGFSGALSAGVRLDRWRLGIAGIHQQNELHRTSWAQDMSLVGAPRSDWTGKTRSFALMIEASHVMPVYSSLFMNFDLGVGHRWSKSTYKYVGDPLLYSPAEDNFLWSVGTGFGWSFSEQISMLLAYRYLGDDLVPTHNVDLGLEFDF
jgi:hypothetical protein